MGDLRDRVIVAVPAITLAVLMVWAGGGWLAAGLTGLGLVCLHELFSMYERTGPPKLAGFLGLVALILAATLGDLEHVLLVLVASVPLTFLLAAAGPRGTALGIAVVVLGLVWVGLGLAHALLLRDLEHGGGIIAGALAGTLVGDSGAYFGGRLLGRRRLAPRISPHKTWEGLWIGIATAIAAVWFTGLYQDWLSGTDALLLGLAVGLAAPVGDLFESFVKRDAGVKDTGRLFGAHGGALDRLDALLFTAVVAYWVWRALG
ncbi:MAG: phosphatidate cytidylyltransferase [Solirubrobacterales bacterium]|nr:phosphatidate cytidylyltransferase [Solirubrobacterales bacterium]